MRSLWLMYHEVYLHPDPEVPRSAAMYHVSKDAFESQMQIVQESGLFVARPREALRPNRGTLWSSPSTTVGLGPSGTLFLCLRSILIQP